VLINNPEKWLILQYDVGAGGKFLATALTTIDAIAYWSPDVEFGRKPFAEWLDTQWTATNNENWLDTEPLPTWNQSLNFFSRSLPRGNDLTLKEFNTHINNVNDSYFKYVWENKILVDFIHQVELPVWWQNSKIVRLLADVRDPTYQQSLLHKVLPFNDGIGICNLDKPNDVNPNMAKFNNQWKYTNFASANEWLDYMLETDSRFSSVSQHYRDADLMFNDLSNRTKLFDFVHSVAEYYNSTVDVNNLEILFDYRN
jgi:hypothetical protein